MRIRTVSIVALILALFVSSCAAADSTVDTIMNTGTTQAFTEEAVSGEDLTTILRAGLSAASAINQQPSMHMEDSHFPLPSPRTLRHSSRTLISQSMASSIAQGLPVSGLYQCVYIT